MFTVKVTSYSMESPTLAKVIVTTTGNPSKSQIRASLSEQMNYLAQPVANSFRQVKNGVYAGFILSNREVRVLADEDLKNGYRVLSSAANIVMDRADETLWQVKSGSGGSYLARHGNENLAELIENHVEASAEFVVHASVPKVSQLTVGQAANGEFVAFVAASGEMDYGFVIKTAADKCKVVSHATKTETIVQNRMVAGFYPVEIPHEVHAKVIASVPNLTASTTKMDAADYWKRAFAFAPEYANQLVDFIEESADA